MNKKRRTTALIIIGILVILATLGIMFAKHIMDSYKNEENLDRELAQKLGSDFFTSFENDAKNQTNPDPVPLNNPPNEQNQQAGDSAAAKLNSVIAKEGVTDREKDIMDNYLPRLEELQQVACSRLETLTATAYQEYREQKKAGTLNRVAFAQKYLSASELLESNIDKKFEGILNEMKVELEKNHYSTGIIKDIRSEYDNAKAGKKQELLNRARNKS